MKKIVVTFAVVCLFIGVMKAQTVDFGLKGGLMYSAMDAKKVGSFSEAKSAPKAGYIVGVFARIGNKLFFQPEIQYRVRTSNFDFGDVAKSVYKDEIEVKYKTLDVPLQLGFNIVKLPIVKLTMHAGPVASFKLAEDTSLKNEVANFDIDKFKDYKSFVWSGQVGIAADIMNFTLDVSYEKGLSDLSKHIGKNDLVLVTLGFKLF